MQQTLDESGEQLTVDIALYDRYASRIYTSIYRQTSNHQDAEDLLLEVFLAAWKDQRFPALAENQQLAWLLRVARNKVIDSYRRNKRFTVLTLDHALEKPDEQISLEEHVLQQETYEHLYQAIGHLSEAQQQIVRLRYGNHLRLGEIAIILNKSEGAVRNSLHRALRHLRRIYIQV